MPELAVGYISLVADTKQIPGAVRKAFGQAEGAAESSGKSMGAKMSGALGKALKAGGSAVAAAGVAAVGTAMVKGFQRLDAIDQAKSKLSGLGNSAADVTKIMDNALSSVRGTAFGMGDAAGLAGTMVAAGIKPGKELESTLKRVADSAAIAGTDLGDMGMIWGKAAAKGKIDGEIINQMLERQIPIYDILGKKMGKNAEEIADMVSEGKISFQDFSDAMNDKIGGAALKTGETVKGAFNNMTAALGRVGASALEPFFKRLPAGFGGVTSALDELEPKIKSFAQSLDDKIFNEWGPKLESAMQTLRETGALDDLMAAMRGLRDTGVDVAPAMKDIGVALAQAGGALGVGTWQIFLTTLQAVGGALTMVAPILEAIGSFMREHPKLVAIAAAAWLLFKTVPSLLGRVQTATAPVAAAISRMAGAAKGAATGMAGFARANNAVVQMTSVSHAKFAALAGIVQTTNGRFRDLATNRFISTGSAMVRMSEAAGVSQQRLMQLAGVAQTVNGRFRDLSTNRFISTADAMQRMGAQAGIAQGRMGSMIAGIGRHIPIVGSMQTAFVNAAAGAERFGRTAGAFAAVRTGAAGAGRAISGLVGALGGPLNAALIGVTVGFTLVSSQMSENRQHAKAYEKATLDLAASQRELGRSLIETQGAVTDETWSKSTATMDAYRQKLSATADTHKSYWDSLKTLDMFRNGQETADQNGIAEKAMVSEEALKKLGLTNDELARKVYGSKGAWASLQNDLMQMGSSGMQARHELASLRTEFLRQQSIARQLTPGFTEVSEAIKLLGDDSVSSADKMNALKQAMDSLNPTRNKAQAMKQWGDEVRAATEAAAGIDGSAFDLSGNLDASSEAGGKFVDVLTGLAEKAANVASTGGDMAKVTKEQDQIFQQLATSTGKSVEEIKKIYSSMGGNVVDIAVKLKGAPESIQQLGAIKAAMDANPDLKEFKLSAEGSEEVQAALTNLGIKMTKTPDGKLIKVDLTGDAGKKLQDVINAASAIPPGKDIKVNAPGGQAVYDLLKGMGIEVKQNNDKTISADIPAGSPVLQMLRDIGYEVDTRNGKNIVVKADDADYRAKKDDWAAPIYKNMYVTPQMGQLADSAGVMGPGLNGSGRYHEGGYTGPGSKYQPAGVVHADEFVIRKESRQKIEATHPGLLDSMNQSGVVGGYADGGRVGFSGKQLRELVDGGHGASRPLTGAPYDWGGVNWGDCSGAVSAPARAAVGLDPFGGRMSTGSMAADLPALGFQQGRWRPGAIAIGYMNGGPGGGHAAETLPDGTNVEMGGSYGGGMVGGTVGANDAQFTDQWFYPVSGGAQPVDPFRPFEDRHEGDPNYQPGQGGSTSGAGGKGTSFSDRLGGAASAFVGGQLSSLFGVLGINDSPGGLAALNEYESQRGQNDGTSGKPTDPGTHKPAEGEDTGKSGDGTTAEATATGIDGIKDAFKGGLREAWRTGAEWDASDWIVNKESSWKPDAKNGKYWGLIQAGREVYEAAGIDPTTTDPAEQAKAFDRYVEDRYKLPTAAKTFHEANNWYDQGGEARGIGMMLKNTIRPERVLSPDETAAFQVGMRRGFSGDDRMLARLDRLIDLTERLHERIGDGGGDTFNFPDRGNARENITQVQRAKRVAALAGV